MEKVSQLFLRDLGEKFTQSHGRGLIPNPIKAGIDYGGSLSFAAVVTCLNVLLPCLADLEAGGPSKPAAVHTTLPPA